MSEQRYNVLFLCTGNSARSILAESILNRDGADRFTAYSAGSRPTGEVHPLALALLGRRGFAVDGLRSKSWDEFAVPGTPQLDLVITVCDSAAEEVCPVWPGGPVTVHWGIPDPVAVEGTVLERAAAFAKAFSIFERRIDEFARLPIDEIDEQTLRARLVEIGRTIV